MKDKEESTELYFKSGSSDKVYKASLEKKGKGYMVNFAYGRRGAAMNTGSKTTVPVDYAEAHQVYTKLIASKVAKGYVPDESGKVFQYGLQQQHLKTKFEPDDRTD